MRISIRYQMMGLIGGLLLGAIAVYLVIATSLFTSDKLLSLLDFNSQLAGTVAEELKANLESQVDRLRYFGVQPHEGDVAARALFAADETVLGLEVYRRGEGDRFDRTYEYVDEARLGSLNLTAEDLREARKESPVPLAASAADEVVIWNASLPPDLGLLRLATRSGDGEQIVVADLRPDRLLRIFTRSKLAKVFLVDARGKVLVHPDLAEVVSHADHSSDAMVRTAIEGRAARGTKEIDLPEGGFVAAFAAVPLGHLSVIVEVPKAKALEAERELSRRSVLFAVTVMGIALLASIYLSRRLTEPLRRLEEKMAVISQGEFGVEVPVTSNNEIGRLAAAFNRMSRELSTREALLMEANAQLIQSEKLSALGEMSAGLAHEVKNPMVGIVGFSELGEGAETLAEAHEYFGLIRADARRANEILQNLLEFARPVQVEFAPLDPGEVVAGAVRLVAHQMAINRVKLSARCEEGLPKIFANANQLRQVLVNLMMNAAHAMEGRPERLLTIATSQVNGAVQIDVSDTGQGMAADVRQKIFRPFFTTKPRGKGTGLGLSVSRSIIEQHKGEISVSSEPEKGTTFHIRLPPASGVLSKAAAAG